MSHVFTGGGFGGHLRALRHRRPADAPSTGSNSTSNTYSSEARSEKNKQQMLQAANSASITAMRRLLFMQNVARNQGLKRSKCASPHVWPAKVKFLRLTPTLPVLHHWHAATAAARAPQRGPKG